MLPELERTKHSERWHKRRARGSGGSEYHHMLSHGYPQKYKYGCVRRLWFDKKGVKPDYESVTNFKMARGLILEPIVAELFKADTGCRYSRRRPKAKELWSGQPRPDVWVGNPDRIAIMPPDDDMVVLELKTMSSNMFFKISDNGLPDSHKLQPQHYLGLTGLKLAWVAVMWPDGLDYVTEPVSRDRNTLELMYDALMWFWGDVMKSSKPPRRPPLTEERCGDCPWRRRCLGEGYYEEHVIKTQELDHDNQLYALLLQREDAKDEAREAEKRKKELDNMIKTYLRENYPEDGPEHFFCRDMEVKYEKKHTSRFDRRAAQSDPELREKLRKYIQSSPIRSLVPRKTKRAVERWEYKQRQIKK